MYIVAPLAPFAAYMPTNKCSVNNNDGSQAKLVMHKPRCDQFLFGVHDVLLYNFSHLWWDYFRGVAKLDCKIFAFAMNFAFCKIL